MSNSLNTAALESAPSYRVIIDGLQDGHTLDHVTERLAALFKRTAEQMQKLLAAPRAIIKKQIDYASALQFQQALNGCGCICVIEPETELGTALESAREARREAKRQIEDAITAGVEKAAAALHQPPAAPTSAPAPSPAPQHDAEMQRWLQYNNAAGDRLVPPAPAYTVQPAAVAATDIAAPSPYAPPRASLAQVPNGAMDPEQARQLATGQKFVIGAMLGNVAAASMQSAAPALLPFVALAGLVLGLIGVLRLAKGLKIGLGARFGVVLLLMLPLINIIVLGLLNRSATRRLRDAGYSIGLFGVRG